MIIKSSKWSLLNYKSRVFFVRLTASFGSWFFPIACAYIYPEVGLALVFLFVKSSRFISAFGNFGIATIIESDNITEKIMNSHAILLFFLFVGYVTWSNIYSINFDIVDTLIVSNGFTGSLLLNYRSKFLKEGRIILASLSEDGVYYLIGTFFIVFTSFQNVLILVLLVKLSVIIYLRFAGLVTNDLPGNSRIQVSRLLETYLLQLSALVPITLELMLLQKFPDYSESFALGLIGLSGLMFVQQFIISNSIPDLVNAVKEASIKAYKGIQGQFKVYYWLAAPVIVLSVLYIYVKTETFAERFLSIFVLAIGVLNLFLGPLGYMFRYIDRASIGLYFVLVFNIFYVLSMFALYWFNLPIYIIIGFGFFAILEKYIKFKIIF